MADNTTNAAGLPKPGSSTEADTKQTAARADKAAGKIVVADEDGRPAGASAVATIAETVDADAGTYTVAPGRTVDGKGPGKNVKLDKGDAQRMSDLGFILDKDGAITVRGEGPAVNVEDGIQVKTG